MTARTVQQLFDLTGRRALITAGSRGLGWRLTYRNTSTDQYTHVPDTHGDDAMRAFFH